MEHEVSFILCFCVTTAQEDEIATNNYFENLVMKKHTLTYTYTL